jgi:hypothetical protein
MKSLPKTVIAMLSGAASGVGLGILVLLLLSLVSSASAQTHDMSKTNPPAAKSDAQVEFDSLKTLAGNWEGPVTVDPPMPQMTDGHNPNMHLTMRVASRGNTIVHEFQEAGTPLDANKYDHPITMLYLDNDQLNLIHYCDAGNRPHMLARKPEGKTVEFDLIDVSGGLKYGHMEHAVFTLIDADHHTEDWTYTLPGNKQIKAHFDLHRVNTPINSVAGQ